MREIKFRGISEDNSEWVYGYYLSDIATQKDLWSPIRNNNYLQWVVIGNIHQNPELLNQ